MACTPVPGGGHLICVRDNGVGFDPALAGELFTPLQRLHLASEFDGIGMGLATVRHTVERHGGSVSATAREGGGAEICLRLPA